MFELLFLTSGFFLLRSYLFCHFLLHERIIRSRSNRIQLRCNSRSKINQVVGTHLLDKFPASRELRFPYLSKTLRCVRYGFSSRIFVRERNERFPSRNCMMFSRWNYWFSSVFSILFETYPSLICVHMYIFNICILWGCNNIL